MILRTILYLMGCDPKTSPLVRACECRPARFGPHGARIPRDTINRLERLYSRGVYLREQMEAAEAECCELLDCDPESDSSDANWAKEIVSFGIAVPVAIEQIEKLRSVEDRDATLTHDL